MKNIYFLVLALIGTTVFAAETKSESTTSIPQTNEIIVKVLDKSTGETLTGVAVKFNDQLAYSDFEGELTFENIESGNHTISTSLISYKAKQMNITIDNNKQLIALELESIDSE